MSNTMKDALKKAGIKSQNEKRKNGQAPKPMVSAVKKGKVKWFDIRKGIGFITGEDGQDYFIHHSKIGVGRNFVGFIEGDEVSFSVSSGSDGRLQAVRAMITEPEMMTQRREAEEEVDESAE